MVIIKIPTKRTQKRAAKVKMKQQRTLKPKVKKKTMMMAVKMTTKIKRGPPAPETQAQVSPTAGQEIIDIPDTPPPPAVVRRVVTVKDGSEEECNATLPGREYYSDDIEDADFDETQREPPYVNWSVDVKEMMSASEALVKRYDKFFSTENQKSIKGGKGNSKGWNTTTACE
jgi:hypothetical protein